MERDAAYAGRASRPATAFPRAAPSWSGVPDAPAPEANKTRRRIGGIVRCSMSIYRMPRGRTKIKRTRELPRIAPIAAMAIALSACGGPSRSPDLPPTPILRIKSRWAVVKVAYARVKTDPSSEAKDLGYLRKGAIVEVFAREYGREVSKDERGYWLGVRVDGGSGWIFSGYLELFDRKEQASRASAAVD